jgi:hypothetical protein
MEHMFVLPEDSNPISYLDLPSSSVGLSFHNNQRKRLVKIAKRYITDEAIVVETLRSQGEVDTNIIEVITTRQAFNQLRMVIPLMLRYYNYSADNAALKFLQSHILAWVDGNIPTGKPIDESNFEGLLHAIATLFTSFTQEQQQQIKAWLLTLKQAKQAWLFPRLNGEGLIKYGNHYTHHYKILLQVLFILLNNGEAVQAEIDALVIEINDFITFNYPHDNQAIKLPPAYNVVGTNVAGSRLDIAGQVDLTDIEKVRLAGNSQGNDGVYSIVSTQYLTSSNKTRIIIAEPLLKDGGGGSLYTSFDDDVDDIPHHATFVGESIDYIRRDALHYHQFNLEPWLEIAIILRNNNQENTAWEAIINAAYEFYVAKIKVTSNKHYEFANTTDDFDRTRYEASKSEYLQPEAMYKPDKVARVIFSYAHLQYLITGDQVTNADGLISYAMRSRDLSAVWFYYFRFIGV